MKNLLLLLLFSLDCTTNSFSIVTPKPDVSQIRKQMLRAINNSKVTDSLYNNLKITSKKTPLITAYFGALEALKAKDSWNPYNKVKFLNRSNTTVNQAVNSSPNDFEIRFIRFSIQLNLPKFLGLSKDLQADKNQILQQLKQKHYGSADKLFVQNIIKFMVDSKQCTAQEIAFLHEQSAQLK
ncbi:MAG: hypothetical protein ACRYFA_06725 [Janthinobacterium lividum]